VLFGDPLQFQPFGDTSLFNNDPKTRRQKHAGLLFAEFKNVIRLSKNHRAVTDPEYAAILSDLREPSHFHDDSAVLRAIQLLNTRVVQPEQITDYNQERGPPVILVATNKERYLYTNVVRDLYLGPSSSTGPVYEWTSPSLNDTPWTDQRLLLMERYFYETSTKCKGLPRFWAFPGMPVAVTKNPSKVKQKWGIATGAHGVVVGFQFSSTCVQSREPDINKIRCSEPPECIFVKFDTPTIQYPGLPPGVLPIVSERETGSTRFPGNKARKLRLKYRYLAFPLKHRFVATYQSVQCLTSKNVCLSLPAIEAMKGEARRFLYMGLSRAISLQHVRLLQPLTRELYAKFKPSARDKEIQQQLVNAHKATWARFKVHDEYAYNL
jgi:hypothetical protein